MSSGPCTAWLAWKLWQSCNVINSTSVLPVYVYFFQNAQPYSINFYVLFITLFQLPRHKNIKLAVRERKMKNFWCVNVSWSSCQSFDDKKAALSFQSMLDEHPSTEMAAKDNKPVRDDKWDKFYIYVMAWEKDNNHKKDWRWTNANLKDNYPFRSLDTYN